VKEDVDMIVSAAAAIVESASWFVVGFCAFMGTLEFAERFRRGPVALNLEYQPDTTDKGNRRLAA
jgi:hypothetical protein